MTKDDPTPEYYKKLFAETNAQLAKSSAARTARRNREIAAFRKRQQLDKIEALAADERGDANVRAVAEALAAKLRRPR